ncbi:MAG: outer membrane protein assembly factor BamB family protein, partial [Bacteroidales bacterium]
LLLSLFFSFQPGFAQSSCNWPCFHGPERNNKSADTDLPVSWPEGGPPLLWKADGLGKGYSTVSFDNGRIYTSGMIDSLTYVIALDMEGIMLWKIPNGISWQTELPWARTYDGARSTPTCDSGWVYHLGELGRLVALDQQTGEEQWSMELRERFNAEIPEYGYAESVLIEGNRLYCCPAGEEGFVVCLDKRDGSLIWENHEIPGSVGFSSLIRYDMDGIPMLTGLSSSCIFSVDAETGRLLWTYPFENSRSNNIPDPLYEKGRLFATSGYGKGSILLDISVKGEEVNVRSVWQNDFLDNLLGGVILHKGFLYGSGDRSRGWFCIDFKTGNPLWKSGGKGSITYADGMLYCLDERGTMTLVNANPTAFYPAGSFRVPESGSGMYWAHPVVCSHKLYIRHDETLFVYDLDGF